MKVCGKCGREYADGSTCCATNKIFSQDGLPPIPDSGFASRRNRIFELILVCGVAFGRSLIVGGYFFFGKFDASALAPLFGAYHWIDGIWQEVCSLGLLWYILLRRGNPFKRLGLDWSIMDVPRSIALCLTAWLIFWLAYRCGYYVIGAVPSGISPRVLFSSGISIPLTAFLFLNPIFEELLVRAYVMTEIFDLTKSWLAAILVSTLLQAGYHLYQGGLAAFSYVFMFLVFSIYFARSRRIGPVILAHLYLDVGITMRYFFAH